MNEEENKAIELLERIKRGIMIDVKAPNVKIRNIATEKVQAIETALNRITKLQKENKEKDKQIDLMAEMIDELSEYYTRYWGKNNEFCKEECVKKDIDCKDCIKQYFERKSKEC